MTTSDHTKVYKQLEVKPAKLQKYIKHNKPKDRKFGASTKKCKLCGQTHAHVGQFGIGLCRQCFREDAKKIGFKKYS